jgi:hypothetical protein
MTKKFKSPKPRKIEKELLGACQHVVRGASFLPGDEDPSELPETCDRPAYARHGERVYCRKHVKIHISGDIEEYGGDEPAGEYTSPEETDFNVEIDVDESGDEDGR